MKIDAIAKTAAEAITRSFEARNAAPMTKMAITMSKLALSNKSRMPGENSTAKVTKRCSIRLPAAGAERIQATTEASDNPRIKPSAKVTSMGICSETNRSNSEDPYMKLPQLSNCTSSGFRDWVEKRGMQVNPS